MNPGISACAVFLKVCFGEQLLTRSAHRAALTVFDELHEVLYGLLQADAVKHNRLEVPVFEGPHQADGDHSFGSHAALNPNTRLVTRSCPSSPMFYWRLANNKMVRYRHQLVWSVYCNVAHKSSKTIYPVLKPDNFHFLGPFAVTQ